MDSWYLLDESTSAPSPTGPFRLAQLERMVQEGRLLPSSRVAAVGSSAWQAASSDPILGRLFRTAPPIQPSSLPPAVVPASGGSYSFGAAWSMGFASFTSKWTHWLVLGLVWIGIAIVLALPQWATTFVATGMEQRSGPTGETAMLTLGGTCIGVILQFLLGLPLFAGLVYASGRVHDGDFKIENLFQGFRRYGRALGAGGLLMLAYVGCGIAMYVPILVFAGLAGVLGATVDSPAVMVAGSAVGILIGVVLFVVLMSRIMVRIVFAPTIAIDPAFGQLGTMEAFRLSWQHTSGLGPSMFGLLVVTGLMAGLSILLLCVGYILVGIPLLLSILGAIYLLVHRNRAGAVLSPA